MRLLFFLSPSHCNCDYDYCYDSDCDCLSNYDCDWTVTIIMMAVVTLIWDMVVILSVTDIASDVVCNCYLLFFDCGTL